MTSNTTSKPVTPGFATPWINAEAEFAAQASAKDRAIYSAAGASVSVMTGVRPKVATIAATPVPKP